MRIDWHSEARQDLQEFDKRIQELLMERVDAMEEAPLGDNTSLLSKQGLEIFRLKLKNTRLDHRIFFDLDGEGVVILDVEHRDNAYTQESIKRTKPRK